MMSFLCLVGWHSDELALAPMRCRCTRCGRETSGWTDDVPVPGATVRFAGHLTAVEVRHITRRTKRGPVYVTPQVTAELAAAAVVAQAQKKRGLVTHD